MGYIVEPPILYLLIISTLVVVLCFLKMTKRFEVKLFVIISGLSVFIYSGYGISFFEVNNYYVIHYLIALVCLFIPFPIIFKQKAITNKEKSSLDMYIGNHGSTMKMIAIAYLIIVALPMFFPKFRFFDVFSRGITIEDRYEFINAIRTDAFKRLCITFSTFLKPFFFAYLLYVRYKIPKSKVPIILFALDVVIGVMDACYIGRGSMIYNFILLYFLWFCIKDGEFLISKRQALTLLIIAIGSLPFMYAYTFIRQGLSYESLPFFDTISLLVSSESGCPTFYDHILSSSVLDLQTPLAFILWLIFLPIPSLIWPNKPSLANDIFTYSITGLHKTDIGYSSLVPSFLGEGFMFFGEYYFWIYALITGFVFAVILRYLLKSRYMIFFVLYLCVCVFSIGRAGATAVIPTYINGTLSVFILDYFIFNRKNNNFRNLR